MKHSAWARAAAWSVTLSLLAPGAAKAAGWHTIVTTDEVNLSAAEQYEETPRGSIAYVYFRLHNDGEQRVACEVHADVTCAPSQQSVPITLHVAPDDIPHGPGPFGNTPYFAQAVCQPDDRIDHIVATLGIEAAPGESHLASIDMMGRTPPPPPGYGMPPLSRRVRHTHPGDANSVGWRVQLDYGLSGFWQPTRNTIIFSDGVSGTAQIAHSGGIGPRLALTFWPYLSRRLGLSAAGLIEGAAMGITNGYTDATHARFDLGVEVGERTWLSGVAQASLGYRYAESHSGNPYDLGHADATSSAGISRASLALRLCTSPRPTLPFCRMGFDMGAAYEMPTDARAAAGGLLLQGSFWLRHTLAVQVEGGWSYPVGGRSTLLTARDDGRSSLVSIAFVFSDDFFDVYHEG